MSGRGEALVRKAVRALSAVEREDLLVEVLLHHAPSTPTPGQPAASAPLATPPSDVDRLTAVLGDPAGMGAPAAAMKVLPIRLPEITHDRLRRFCGSSGFSMATVIRTLVERFLDSQPEEATAK